MARVVLSQWRGKSTAILIQCSEEQQVDPLSCQMPVHCTSDGSQHQQKSYNVAGRCFGPYFHRIFFRISDCVVKQSRPSHEAVRLLHEREGKVSFHLCREFVEMHS